jgi:hypothetical protein
MTRANLNFVSQEPGEKPRTLYWYHNGDQYPTGIRDFYHLLDWLESGLFTPEGFTRWISKNYSEQGTAIPYEIASPCVYYDDNGFPTDYSYVFDATLAEGHVLVYNWTKCIFYGKLPKFIAWLRKQKR